MKRLLSFALCLCVFGTVTVDPAHAARARSRSINAVCPSVESLPNGKYIYKNSAPLRRGGVGTPLIGYRKEPTLIYNKRNFAGGRHTVYDSNGKSLMSCQVTSAHGHAGRARCTAQTANVRRAAMKNTRSPAGFFKITSKLCVKIPDLGRCYGSVKGLCNRTIS